MRFAAPIAFALFVVALPVRAIEAEQKNRLAGDRRHVNRAIEGDAQSRLHVEAVKRVDHVEVLAVRLARSAVDQGQADPPARVLAGVLYGEAVARKRLSRRSC